MIDIDKSIESDIVEAVAGFRPSRFSLLLNPVFWLVQLALIALASFYWYDVGAEHERHAQQALSIKALEAQATANGIVLERERTLRAEDRTAFDKFKQEQSHAEKLSTQLIADLRRDTRRLRVPVRAVCPADIDGSGTVAAGTGEEGHAELTADAGEFLVRLVTRGDDGIRKHAEVVDRYERLRSACTAPVTLATTGTTP